VGTLAPHWRTHARARARAQGAAALHWLEPVMVPLVLAVLLSYCLSPVVDLAERRLGMPHGCAPVSAPARSRRAASRGAPRRSAEPRRAASPS